MPAQMALAEELKQEEGKGEANHLDLILLEIQIAQSEESVSCDSSDSDSEEDEHQAQEPDQFIKENLNKRTAIKLESEQEFSDDSFDE